jgi:hypothetical protein
LVKPDGTDLVDIAVINSNYDKIDANIASTKIQATKPATANAGDLWWDSNTGTLYLYYVDANSAQWVAATSDPVNIGVVANQSDRDAQYPTPGQGMTVFRLDLGYSETYYGLYNVSTNPGGRTPAGWYREKGQILQVVTNFYPFQVNNNTTTYATTGVGATITPTKTSSQIIVIANVNGIYREQFNAGGAAQVELRRGATALANITNIGYTGTGLLFIGGSANFSHVDSPNTTSAITYEVFIRSVVAGNGAGAQQSGSRSDITLIEVSA